MTKKVKIHLKKPHKGQERIIKEARRFNCIPCARRFGKTELMTTVKMPLIAPAVFYGKEIAIFAPVFKDISKTWRNILTRYKDLISEKDNQKHIIYFHGGGIIYFWSLANDMHKDNGRGYSFHRVIYEEIQKIPNAVLKHHWEEAARPALTDYKGDGYFIGTPNGKNSFWYQLNRKGVINGRCEINAFGEEDIQPLPDLESDNRDWMTFRMITTDNPNIDPEEVLSAAGDLDEQSYHQEYFAVFVNYEGQAWAYVLKDRALQNKVFQKASKVNFSDDIYIAFDFNKVPMTALVMQKKYLSPVEVEQTKFKYAPLIKKEFKVGTVHKPASIFDTCKAIREWIYQETGRKIGKWEEGNNIVNRYPNVYPIKVTGDASGNVTSGMVKDPTTFYKIIMDELQLLAQDFTIPKSNPFHADSHLQLNTIYSRCPHVVVDIDNCQELKKDLLRIKDDGRHGIAKSAGEATQADLLDCNRYLFNTFCKDIRTK
jgi:hypothetical protein